jgi:lipopolysaccharide/colanic/teichoic acid biosynthesis glycosyltransferase
LIAIPSSFAKQGRRLPWGDVAAALLAPAIAVGLRGILRDVEDAVALAPYWMIAVAASLAFLIHFRVGQILPRFMSRRDVIQIVKMAAAASAFAAAGAFSLWRLEFLPRSIPILHFVALVGLTSGWRLVYAAVERSRRDVAVTTHSTAGAAMLIVGVNATSSLLIRLIKSLGEPRPSVAGLLDDDRLLHGRSVDGHMILGGLDRFEAVVAELASHGVFVRRVLIAHVEPAAQERSWARLAAPCDALGIEVEVFARRLGLSAQEHSLTETVQGGAARLSQACRRSQRYLRRRRYVETALAGAGLIVLSPLLLLVAAAIRVRLGGPVTFWQQRVGLNGAPLVVHKFRTLLPAVDAVGRPLSDAERSTALGRFLRATRLDELPQLYDIFRGQMSLIGPRPLLPVDLPAEWSLRQSVRPGLTGWAQVHGGKDVTADEKNALDEWYVHHASLSLDLKILWRTLRIVFTGDMREDGAIDRAMQFRAERLARPEDEHVSAAQITAAAFARRGAEIVDLTDRVRRHVSAAPVSAAPGATRPQRAN